MIGRLKTILSVILLLFVFLGTTGVTFYHHVCACRPVTSVVTKSHSCCDQPPQEHSCCSSARQEKPAEPATGCAHHHKGCKDVPVYFTASILGVPAVKEELLTKDLSPVDLPSPLFPEENMQDTGVDFVFTAEDPPPIPGKQILFSIHQLKIPFIA
jgi:hypothetical protein